MKRIRLTNGGSTKVSDRDYKRLRKHNWYKKQSAYSWYACRCVVRGERKITLRMHRVIMNCPKNREVHHKNADSLDNRRGNLEVVKKEGGRHVRKRKEEIPF